MNRYEEAVKWLKENYEVIASNDELRFMRHKAQTVFSCNWCLSNDDPFAHLIASIICNWKNMDLLEKIKMSDCPTLAPYSMLHYTNLGAEWSGELDNLILEGKIKPY